MSPRTYESSASLSMLCAVVAIRGMSMSFFTGGCDAYRRAASAMLTAMSPTRSRSLLILIAAMTRAQVGRHRRVQREQLQAQVVDFDVQLVEGHVAVEHLVDELAVALDEPLHRRADAIFREPAHGEQPLFQRPELLLEMMAFH